MKPLCRSLLLLVWAVLCPAMASAQQADGDLPYRPDTIPVEQYSPNALEQRYISDPRSRPHDRYLAIYGGSTAGVYFRIAGALCAVMEHSFDQHGIRCAPLRSGGVGSNVQLMREGRAQVMIVQSDTNYQAANGELNLPGARSLMSLHNEAGVLVVRRGSGIGGPRDLPGKRINLGPIGSASNALWQEYLASLGLAEADFRRVYAIPQDINRDALCGDTIDVFGLWIGHPAPVIDNILALCDADLVGMWDSALAGLLEQKRYLFRQTIPAGTYARQQAPLSTYGIKASLVAYERLDADIAYWLVRAVAENLDVFRAQHPALAHLQLEEMVADGNFLPFHEGAARYWRERQMLAKAGGENPAKH